MRVTMCKCGYVTWVGIHCCSWWSHLWSVPPASACTSWIDHGSHHSKPAPRQMASAITATSSNKNPLSATSFNLKSWFFTKPYLWYACTLILRDKQNEPICPYLGWVLIGCSERAVRVSGVKTGSIHVAVPNACLFQHFLKTFYTEVCPSQVLKELLGVKVGPLKRGFTSDNVKINRNNVTLYL